MSINSEPNALASAAGRYAELGVRTVPFREDRPEIGDPELRALVAWKKEHAGTDAQGMAEVFARHQGRANLLALVTGERFDVLDVDSAQARQQLVEAAGEPPKAYGVASTPNGGWHYYIPIQGRGNAADMLGNGAGHNGVDYRGKGGLVFAAPSTRRRRSDGQLVGYEWVEPLDLDDAEVSSEQWRSYMARVDGNMIQNHPVPDRPEPSETTRNASTSRWKQFLMEKGVIQNHTLERVDVPQVGPERGRAYAKAALASITRELASTPEGGRNEALNAMAFRLGQFCARGWLEESQARHELLGAMHTNGYIADRGAAKAEATFASGMRAGKDNPAEDPPERYDGGEVSLEEALDVPDAWEVAVARELRRLKVRDEARRRYAEQQRAEEAPIDLGTLGEILAREPEPAHRIDGLAPWGGSVVLVAQHKTGKTTLSANYARALITGHDFLGAFAVRPLTGRVAVLNYEVSAQQMARWFHDVGVPEDRCILINLRGTRNPLASEVERQELAAKLRELDVEAMIVDPFGRAFTGQSQNDAGEVGSFLADLDRFKSEAGAVDLLLAVHAGWQTDRARGSTAITDWGDAIWTMTKDNRDNARYFSAIGRDVDLEEDRLHFDEDTRLLTLSGTGGQRAAAQAENEAELREKILKALGEFPQGLSGRQLSDAVGAKNATYRAVRDRLVEDGTVLTEARQGRGGGTIYVLSDPTCRTWRNMAKPHTSEPAEHAEPLSIEGGSSIAMFAKKNHEPAEAPGDGRQDQEQPPTLTSCRQCGQPLNDIDGQGVHPDCAEQGAA